MKKVFVLFGLLAFAVTVSAQGFIKQHIQKEDHYLTALPVKGESSKEARVRKLITPLDTTLYYQVILSRTDNSGSSVISLTKKELKEAREILQLLVEQSIVDLKSNANYIENEYEFGEDIFLGYFIREGKLTGTFSNGKSTYYAAELNHLLQSFSQAFLKIEQLEKE